LVSADDDPWGPFSSPSLLPSPLYCCLCAAPKLSRVEAVNTNYESGTFIKKSFDDFVRSLITLGKEPVASQKGHQEKAMNNPPHK